MKTKIAVILVSAIMTTFAYDYCRDCDRRIADGKEYCNKCAERRQKNALIAAETFIKMVDNADKQAKKADRRRHERADRQAKAEVARMDSIIRSSVQWGADSKTTSKKYLYQIQRQDGGDLIAYVGDNYKRMAIQKYWFHAKALDEFAPAIPSGSSGYLKINISDGQGHGYTLTNVKMTYNNAKTMTIHLTELSGNRVRCQIWTGPWHNGGDEEVRTIFDRILDPHPDEGMAYYYSVQPKDQKEQVRIDSVTENDAKMLIKRFIASCGSARYVFPNYVNNISFPNGRWKDFTSSMKNLPFKEFTRVDNGAMITYTDDIRELYQFSIVKINGTCYIVAIFRNAQSGNAKGYYDFKKGQYPGE